MTNVAQIMNKQTESFWIGIKSNLDFHIKTMTLPQNDVMN